MEIIMQINKQKILIIADHQDNEMLGCGGTIKKLALQNNEIFIAILSEDITSRSDTRAKGLKNKVLKKMPQYVSKEHKALNVTKTFLFNLPDNRFDSLNLLDIIKIIESLITTIQSTIIFTHNQYDLNIDNQITYQAVLTACRPPKFPKTNTIYTFEILSSTEWNYPQKFIPNVYVNITDTIEYKLKTMSAYKSEIENWPHPRSLEGIKILADKKGSEICISYAEAFQLIRKNLLS